MRDKAKWLGVLAIVCYWIVLILSTLIPPISRLSPLLAKAKFFCSSLLATFALIPAVPLFHFTQKLPYRQKNVCIAAFGFTKNQKKELYATHQIGRDSKSYDFFRDYYEVMFPRMLDVVLYRPTKDHYPSAPYIQSIYASLGNYFCHSPEFGVSTSGPFEAISLLDKTSFIHYESGNIIIRNLFYMRWSCTEDKLIDLGFNLKDDDARLAEFGGFEC